MLSHSSEITIKYQPDHAKMIELPYTYSVAYYQQAVHLRSLIYQLHCPSFSLIIFSLMSRRTVYLSDQTAWMRNLFWSYIVRMWHKDNCRALRFIFNLSRLFELSAITDAFFVCLFFVEAGSDPGYKYRFSNPGLISII